ncbi:MAG: bifunctional alpha,alpha-trehalose-phosphate synthase (UDP-forming)/trehalose-phosphatase [Bacteroidota bacterium]
MSAGEKQRRLLIVSNRLPFNIKEENGAIRFLESSGGLVTGLSAYLDSLGVTSQDVNDYMWVGWPGGTVSDTLKKSLTQQALSAHHSFPVFLSEEEMDQFYLGFCNKTIWPLFHYFNSYASYREEYWQQYRRVNQIFADAVAEIVRPDDLIWVHDYHLMLLPQLLKARVPNNPVGFFLHIPFPSFEIFRLLPGEWRRQILHGLLGSDLIGFHTYDYTQHFLQCVLRILGHEHTMGLIVSAERVVKTESFPMGIDFDKFASATSDPRVAEEGIEFEKSLAGMKVILSVDRQDYTKGILHRLEGFEILLDAHPEYRGKIVLLMVVVPSRIGVEQYDTMKKLIEELVGKINGRFGSVGWTPILYQYRHVPFFPLVALYRISDIALVTPLRDGMNLVAKEYVATRSDNTGVLILSEMAGASKELGEAVIVNPNNREEIAGALCEALEMPVVEQQRRNRVMRDRIRRYNVTRWAGDFVRSLIDVRILQNKYYAKLISDPVRQHMFDEYRQSARRLIFLDYDGTLVPFARRPEMARPTPEVTDLLRQLASDSHNHVVLISGRDKATLEQWFSGIRVTLVAEHGIWTREPRNGWKMFKEQPSGWKTNILPILELYADRLPGSSVEEKEYSVVWHYRGSDPEQAAALSRELLDHLTTFTANIELQVLRGNKVIEVRGTGTNKGSVGLQYLSHGNYNFILSMGDDWTDEDLFKALPETAFTIRVGIANTNARFTVQNIQEVLRLLHLLTAPSG